MASGAAAELLAGGSIPNAWTISGTGTASAGALRSTAGANELDGAITLAGASTIGADSSTSLRLNGSVNGAYALTTAGVGTVTIAGTIGGATPPTSIVRTGSLTMIGGVGSTGGRITTGAITLTGTNLTAADWDGALGTSATVVHTTGGVTGQFSQGTSFGPWRVTYGANDVDLTFVGNSPTLTAITAASGSTSGGTTVTLTGTALYTGTTVTFDGTPCASVTRINATTLTCITPAHAAGVVDVVVTNMDRSATLAGAFTYVTPAPVSDSSASTRPAVGPLGTAKPVPAGRTATVAKPRFAAASMSVTTRVVARSAGRLTQTITTGAGRAIVRCTTSRTLGKAMSTTLSCALNAAARRALETASMVLTVTTIWTSATGPQQRVITELRIPRKV